MSWTQFNHLIPVIAEDLFEFAGTIRFAGSFNTFGGGGGGFFDPTPMVSTLTTFDIFSPGTASLATGDFVGVSGPVVTNDIDTLAPGGVIYSIGGFDFTLTTVTDIVPVAYDCSNGLCSDSKNCTLTGVVTKTGFPSMPFTGTFQSSGTCLEGSFGQCEGGTESASWVTNISVSVP